MQKNLLLVDSDPASLAILRDLLPEQEFHLSVARDGDEGLRMACEQKPHCIIFEVDLLPTSGTLMYSRLRRHASTRQIPAIVYSEVHPRYGTGITIVSKKNNPNHLLSAVREAVAHAPA